MRLLASVIALGACADAPGFESGEYFVELRGATLSATRPDASAWDDDGPPDPYVVVWRGGTRFATSLGTVDTTEPAWNYTFRWALALGERDLLALDVQDDDGPTDELMLACEISITSPEVVPDDPTASSFTCSGDGGQVEVWLRRNAE